MLPTSLFRPLMKWALLALSLGIASGTHAYENAEKKIGKILAGEHRDPANAARDEFRHPKETLLFMGINPSMTVVEIWPSAGWWTEILAPLLRERGKYYAAYIVADAPGMPQFLRDREKAYDAMLAAKPELYDKVVKTKLLAPQWTEIAPASSADMVLTFRNVHNWAKAGNADAMFAAFFTALKPGGILGVKDHRAKPGTPMQEQIATGYMTEEWVIATAEKAGFKLEEKSDINANPKDSKDHPAGVWTLPPTLALKDKDRAKYVAIGESDRMTLRFIKPEK